MSSWRLPGVNAPATEDTDGLLRSGTPVESLQAPIAKVKQARAIICFFISIVCVID